MLIRIMDRALLRSPGSVRSGLGIVYLTSAALLLAILFSLPVLSADADPSSSAPQGLIIDKFEYDPDSMPWHSEDDTVRIESVQAELPDSSEKVPALLISTGEHEPE